MRVYRTDMESEKRVMVHDRKCQCAWCAQSLEGRLFFCEVGLWNDPGGLAAKLQYNIDSWLPRDRLRSKTECVSVVGRESSMYDCESQGYVRILRFIALLPCDVHWTRPWEKVACHRKEGEPTMEFCAWLKTESYNVDTLEAGRQVLKYWVEEVQEGTVFGNVNEFTRRLRKAFPV